MATVGSLAYAEDDGRHILGIKATRQSQVGSSSVGKGTETDDKETSYCCYVFECDNEVSGLPCIPL